VIDAIRPAPAHQATATAGSLPRVVTVVADGRTLQAPEGTFLLEVLRTAGIAIPTLCHHPALEPVGACRLCLVETVREDGPGDLVAACLYPVADGMQVRTHSERVLALRRDMLDLLLARCPDTPLIQRLAREHGVEQTSYPRNPEPTDCILCGLCARVCDHLGFSAIALVHRGTERSVAPPLNQPPPDCVGCLACAEICPTGHLRAETADGTRTIWGRRFPMLRCRSCGQARITEAQADHWSSRSGLPRAYFETCDACKRRATAETMARLGAQGAGA
jgi:bidirectional [NiFe] hydrogenase diaphorase subunit